MLQFSLRHSLSSSSITSVAMHFALPPNCSHSKVWLLPEVIHWAMKTEPVLSTLASVSAVCQKYSPLWLPLTAGVLYWETVPVFSHAPQDLSWHDASPSLLPGSATSHLQKPEERASPGTQLCPKQLLHTIGGATEIVFMLHKVCSGCLLDGNGEPALGSLFRNIQEPEYTWVRGWFGLCDNRGHSLQSHHP